MQFSKNFGLRLDELSQFSAITTKTVTIPGESGIKTEKRQFWKNQNFQNCRFSVLIPDSPGIVTVWVVPALNWLNSSRWSPKFSENCVSVFGSKLTYPKKSDRRRWKSRPGDTRKLLEKMKKNFRSWSHCAQTLNENLRRPISSGQSYNSVSVR